MASETYDTRLSRAVREAVAEVKAEDGILPVRDVARRLLTELGRDRSEFGTIVDALCNECILYGVVIEFQRPED